MQTGAITQYIDVAQLVLYAFWFFLAGVVIYIRREDKREGYPLESERSKFIKVQGWPAMPEPKTFLSPHGGTVQKPDYVKDDRPVKAMRREGWPGAPLEPTGNPMLDGVGPASYAERADEPDLTLDGAVKIVPLRADREFGIASFDLNPLGQDVVGGDGYVAGKVCDVWVDRTEPQVRYLEVEVKSNGRRVLVPWGFVKMDGPGALRPGPLDLRHASSRTCRARPTPTASRCARKTGSAPTTAAARCTPSRSASDPGYERARVRTDSGLAGTAAGRRTHTVAGFALAGAPSPCGPCTCARSACYFALLAAWDVYDKMQGGAQLAGCAAGRRMAAGAGRRRHRRAVPARPGRRRAARSTPSPRSASCCASGSRCRSR